MEKYVERLQALLPISSSGTGGYLPYKDPMSYAINLNRRLGTLNEMILYQYLNLLIPGYGEKGTGWFKHPKKTLYNKVYKKTTFSLKDLFK